MDFQNNTGLKADGIYGPKSQAMMNSELGRQYALAKGYLWDPDSNSYLNASGVSQGPNIVPDVNMTMRMLEAGPAYSLDTAHLNPANRRINMGMGSNTGFGTLQALPQGGLSNTIKPRTSPYVDPYAPANLSKPTVTDDKAYDGQSQAEKLLSFLGKNAGTALQGVGFAAQAISALKKPAKQSLYLNNAPINPSRYDSSQAMNKVQSNFNATKDTISNSVGEGFRNSNMLQAFSNKSRAEADIATKYEDMNQQAQREFEARLGQRTSENNATRYNVDQINDQNLAARNNALRTVFANLGGLGGEINNQRSNKQSMQWLLSAYPDIAKFFEAEANKSKTKKGGYYGRV